MRGISTKEKLPTQRVGLTNSFFVELNRGFEFSAWLCSGKSGLCLIGDVLLEDSEVITKIELVCPRLCRSAPYPLTDNSLLVDTRPAPLHTGAHQRHSS